LEFRGTVFTGMGRGAYYVGHPGYQERFRTALGYTPFPGTLNVRLSEPKQFKQKESLRKTRGNTIGAFQVGSESFSSVKCFRGSMGGEEVALTIPKITEYDDSVLEIIAVMKLRDRFGLRDGEAITVSFDEKLVKPD